MDPNESLLNRNENAERDNASSTFIRLKKNVSSFFSAVSTMRQNDDDTTRSADQWTDDDFPRSRQPPTSTSMIHYRSFFSTHPPSLYPSPLSPPSSRLFNPPYRLLSQFPPSPPSRNISSNQNVIFRPHIRLAQVRPMSNF